MASKKRAPPEQPSVAYTVDTNEASVLEIKSITIEGTRMKINFSAVATDFQPHEAGDVEGTLISHKSSAASQASGQPTVTLEWSENDSPNKRIWRTYSLQPKALWSLKRDLIRIGASVEDMNSEEADLDDIITGLYGYVSTIKFGDPRPYKDKDGNDKLGDNMLEVVDPSKN